MIRGECLENSALATTTVFAHLHPADRQDVNGPEEPEAGQQAPEPAHPFLNAMLICDTTLRDQGTNKVSLIGIFDNVFASRFPARHGLLTVYANLTDAQGAYQMRLDLIRLRDLVVIGQGQLDVTLEDRVGVAELEFQLSNLVFTEPGRYEFRLFANGRSVGGKTFNVIQLP